MMQTCAKVIGLHVAELLYSDLALVSCLRVQETVCEHKVDLVRKCLRLMKALISPQSHLLVGWWVSLLQQRVTCSMLIMQIKTVWWDVKRLFVLPLLRGRAIGGGGGSEVTQRLKRQAFTARRPDSDDLCRQLCSSQGALLDVLASTRLEQVSTDKHSAVGMCGAERRRALAGAGCWIVLSSLSKCC